MGCAKATAASTAASASDEPSRATTKRTGTAVGLGGDAAGECASRVRGGTSSTGTRDRATTSSATLPSTTRVRPVLPWVAITIRSAFPARARSRMLSATVPERTAEPGSTAVETEAGDTEVVRFLLDKGADINARSQTHWTPLMCAAAEGHTEIVKLLVSRGADRRGTNADGRTAAAIATMNGYSQIADMLRDGAARAGK